MMSSVIINRLTRCFMHRLTLCIMLVIASNGCTYGPTPYHGGYGTVPYGTSPYGGSPYGTSPYGTGYPGGYQVPTQTLQPGQQYVPGGTVVPQGVYPGGTPTYQNNNTLSPIPNHNGGASTDAPPFSSTEINKQVPNPSTPTGSPFYNNSSTSTFQPPIDSRSIQPATHSQEPIQSISNQLRESHAAPLVPGPTATYSPPPSNLMISPNPMNSAIDINESEIPSVPNLGNSTDPFSTPIPAPSQNDSRPPAMPIFDNISNMRLNKPVNRESETFGYAEDYQWLRGVVSRDEPTGTWSVVYSDNPKRTDEFAGHLSLAPTPYLKGIGEGTVVEVKGMIDPVLKDPLGKPVYLVSHLRTITKPPQQQ